MGGGVAGSCRWLMLNAHNLSLLLMLLNVVYERAGWMAAWLAFRSILIQIPAASGDPIPGLSPPGNDARAFWVTRLATFQIDEVVFGTWTSPSTPTSTTTTPLSAHGVNCIIAKCCFQIFNWKGVLSFAGDAAIADSPFRGYTRILLQILRRCCFACCLI